MGAAPDFLVAQDGLYELDRHSAFLDDGDVKARQRLVGPQQHVFIGDGHGEAGHLECRMRHGLDQRMQRTAGFEAVPLDTEIRAIGIGGVHPVFGAVAFVRLGLGGGDAHVMELVARTHAEYLAFVKFGNSLREDCFDAK
ncbi:hypothetical protein PWG14_06770 (plasmid) [Chromobacterium amazonense]|uniref:hypothetical protein n=1 Tax=Chromobacterium amazonense TaxID=1382803 RepID=UPI00237E6411|nr:hypothetical protein [Chromobacterium amazonense]MDE1712416.1 hypothetical protein [Chromobacterium amazonense]